MPKSKNKGTKKAVAVDYAVWDALGDVAEVVQYTGPGQTRLCPRCGARFSAHGTLPLFSTKQLVCPGDYIVYGAGLLNAPYRLRPTDFTARFTK